MAFLPYFLFWGALGASVPIALHFFYRSRYRIVPWAAMEFLLTSIQQTSRRLKFQELLLLITRVALLVLLALILALGIARTRASWGGGGAVDAILVFDVSGSMSAREGTHTRIELAKKAARDVIDRLPAGSTVQVISCADRARLLDPRVITDLGRAKQLVDGIETTSLGTDFLPGFTEAAKALERGSNPNREVYLFSDMQKRGWQAQSAALAAKAGKMNEDGARIYLIDCTSGTADSKGPANAAILDIIARSDVLHTGGRIAFTVPVRNTGVRPLRDLTVTLEVAGQPKGQDSRSIPELAAGETRPVELGVELNRPGFHVLSARIKPDDLDADNQFDKVVHVREQVRVLIVDGAPNEKQPEKAAALYLTNALAPVKDTAREKYAIQPRVVLPRNAVPALLSDRDICILADCPLKGRLANEGGNLSPPFVEELSRFVKRGGGLMIFGGTHVEPDEYNRLLFDQYGLLPLRLGQQPILVPDDKPPFMANVEDIPRSSFLKLFREEKSLSNPLALAPVIGALDTRELTDEERAPGTVRIDLRYTNGKVALATKHVDRGQVLLCTTTADPRWNLWPMLPVYLPMVRLAIGQVLQSEVQARNRTAGQPLVWYLPPGQEKRPHLLTPPTGDDIPLGLPRTDGGRARIEIDNTGKAGVYQITPEANPGEDPERVTSLDRDTPRDPSGARFAVTPDLQETENLDPLGDGEIDELLGFSPVHVKVGEAGVGDQVAEGRSREWTGLLWAVLVLALFEVALAWFCDKAW
jgi:hypothetical protein